MWEIPPKYVYMTWLSWQEMCFDRNLTRVLVSTLAHNNTTLLQVKILELWLQPARLKIINSIFISLSFHEILQWSYYRLWTPNEVKEVINEKNLKRLGRWGSQILFVCNKKFWFGCNFCLAILFPNWFNPIVSFPLLLSLSVVKCDSHCHAICISRVKIDLLIGKR